MTNVKPKHIFLIFVISIISILTYSCIKVSMMFRPLGDRGAIYETFETKNNTFKVKINALDEENVYMPGAYLICESAPIDSDDWKEFLVYRTDDAVSIPRKRFRFLNEQTGYVYFAYDYAVTLDGGKTWKIWKPLFPQSNGEPLYWAITELDIESDGTGQAKVESYDEKKKDRVTLKLHTKDFGQNWNIVEP